MDQQRKRSEEGDESRMSSVQGEKKEKQSIPEKTRFLLYVGWECFLAIEVGTTRALQWRGPIHELEHQLEIRDWGQVKVVEVGVHDDGPVCSFPLLETITQVEFNGYDRRIVIDFPEEILRLPRLQCVFFFNLRVRRIPPAILDTPVRSLLSCTVEPPWFLVESQIGVNGESWFQLERFRRLRQVLLLGLGEENPTTWSSFLKRGLYDPRLFLFVSEFLK